MPITPVSAQPTSATASCHPHSRGHGHAKQAIDAAAKALNIDPADLKQQLRSGQSLDDIATSKGVSHDTLVTAMQDGLTQAGVPADNVSAIAERLATRHRGERQGAGASPAVQPLLAGSSGVSLDVRA